MMIKPTLNQRVTKLFAILSLTAPSLCLAGVFLVDTNLAGDENGIIHPYLYLGVGGPLTVNVCVDPLLSEIDAAEPVIVRAIETWNILLGQSPNLTTDVPAIMPEDRAREKIDEQLMAAGLRKSGDRESMRF